MKKIIFTGGGTGGHIMPNIALIEQLKNKYDCKYIGSQNSMEEKLITPLVTFFSITTCKLKRSLSLSNLLIPFKLIKGIVEAKRILKAEKPDLIFSKGGYVAVPVVIAGHMLKIPIVAHESDLSVGLANKLTQKYAQVVCTSFEKTSTVVKNGVYTGSPIRSDVLCGNAQNIKNNYYLDAKLPTVLIVGGSLGSKTINQIVYDNAKEVCKHYNILHLAGNGCQLKSNIKNYHIIGSTQKMGDFYQASDLVITRGGSNVLFELLALKKPMIIVPLQKGSRGDQIENAKEFSSKGLAQVVFEQDLINDSKLILKELQNLNKNKESFIKNMSNQKSFGTQNIIEQIEKVLLVKNWFKFVFMLKCKCT